MNVQGLADQAGRVFFEGIRRRARTARASTSDVQEPRTGELWQKVTPALGKAVDVYERAQFSDTPQSSWIPWCTTKESCQEELEKILDTVLVVLKTCGAADCRERLRDLRAANAASQASIARYREQMLAAPPKATQNFIKGLVESSRESLTDSIADETERIAERNRQIENLTVAFREHLKEIGVQVSADTADSLLLPVEDDIVSMAAVISNIGRITGQLQELVDASKEAPAETKRYYGMYVLLVFAVDRIQTHFVKEVDDRFLPRVAAYEREAASHIANARAQLSRGGPRAQLAANIAANERNIEACRAMRDILASHRRSVLAENRKVQLVEAAAVITYKTVRLSFNVADLVGHCEAAFKALRDLRLPELRPFQNVRLNEELHRLAERVAS